MFKRTKYTKDVIEPLVVQYSSYSDVIRALNLKVNSGNFRMIKQRILCYELDVSHFNGKSISVKRGKNNSYTDEGSRLKHLLIKYGREYKCENGHPPEWMGVPMKLHVDHINGKSNDNRLENLRFLCANCHQITSTWGNTKYSCVEERPKPSYVAPEKTVVCPVCGKLGSFGHCSYECANIAQRKCSLTSQEIFDIWRSNKNNYRKTAREIGISDNGIRKRLRAAGLIS